VPAGLLEDLDQIDELDDLSLRSPAEEKRLARLRAEVGAGLGWLGEDVALHCLSWATSVLGQPPASSATGRNAWVRAAGALTAYRAAAGIDFDDPEPFGSAPTPEHLAVRRLGVEAHLARVSLGLDTARGLGEGRSLAIGGR
jgi:hypothetical protein